jgi:hypothetical protein
MDRAVRKDPDAFEGFDTIALNGTQRETSVGFGSPARFHERREKHVPPRGKTE